MEQMNLHDLMQFATAYSKLGWAIQEQLNDILKSDYSDLNPNAVAEINQRLRGYNEDLDIAIDEALEAIAVEA